MKSRSLKLTLVTRRYPPLIGGAEKGFSYLAKALAAQGADVTVLTSRIPGLGLAAEEDVPIVLSKTAGLNDHALAGQLRVIRLETSGTRFWGTWLYMRNLRRWFQENPVDLAYVSMLKHDAYSVIGASKELGFAVVLRPEGAGATGDVAWQSWGRFGRMIGYRCRQAAAFVAISKPIERELSAAWTSGTMRRSRLAKPCDRIPKEPRVVTIPNGIPIPELTWQPRNGWRLAPRAVFLGRLSPEKGLKTLVDAWPLVREHHANATLTLVGEGPLRPMLEQRVRSLGMSLGSGQAVEMPGVVEMPDEALRSADLFILPSREEGMSIALLEAMAIGIPLVASSIPGNRRLVNDFEHGRLTPPSDPMSLARVISDQWANFDRAIGMGHAARSRAKDEFSIQSVATKHLALFEEILADRRRS